MIYLKGENEPLMCLKSPNGIPGASETFDELEKRIGSLKGRRFYGLSRMENGKEEYFACVRVEAGDEPEKLGLSEVVFEAGRYDREVIRDWSSKWDGDNIEGLPEIFGEMAKGNETMIDESRFSVEYYRSQKELYVYIPLK